MSSTLPLRFAIVGCGRMGRAHTQDLHADGRARVVSLWDIHPTAAKRLQADLAPEAAVHTDVETLLADSSIDAVVLCTPTNAHYEQVLACRERGLPVLCEKPLADRRERILHLIARCQTGPALSVAYQRRTWGVCRRLRDEVRSGRWGTIRAVVSHNREDWQQTISGTWRDDPDVNWGGFIGDAGSHKIDMLFFVTGKRPMEVFARTDRCGSRVEIVGTVNALLEGGIHMSQSFVGNAQRFAEEFHVHCERADLSLIDGRLWIVSEGRTREISPSEIEPDVPPTSAFIDLLLGKIQNIAPADCALPVFDFTRAILESSQRATSVSLVGSA